ncbi:NAD(P)/FAD-dependent oxidoreductase [Kitasatospora sp. NPDC127111]|uniref:NAD(P)/FAD-dependent oxidoreductase n=1 Tax=Kitasatospora sp. NPDC127111 TaxID=3345363 RepID=UPI00363B066C
MAAKPHVLVLGGGFAGLETAFSLHRRFADRVRLTIVADQDSFLFKPNTIYIPFGGDEGSLRIPLVEPLSRRRITFQPGEVAEVEPDSRTVDLSDGTRLRYDFLVVATGAAMRSQEVPGLAQHARAIWTPAQLLDLRGELAELRDAARAGRHRRVLFLVPPNNKCAGPLYEIALMLDTWLRRQKARDGVELTWTTYESGYIQAFGPRLHEVVTREFTHRGIHGHTDAVVSKVAAGEAAYTDGTTRPFDLLVAFPPYVAAVDYPGLAGDDRGFLTTEPATRRAPAHPEVYAPGDAGDFPVKQAFLAFLQADAVADDIAAAIDPTALRRPRPFVPTSMCVMEMFDKATFAQVPLEATGDPLPVVRVAADAGDAYRVGTSPLWRLGKKALGLYLPLQFRAGRPFHQGRPWQAMQLALDGMSRTLASGPPR